MGAPRPGHAERAARRSGVLPGRSARLARSPGPITRRRAALTIPSGRALGRDEEQAHAPVLVGELLEEPPLLGRREQVLRQALVLLRVRGPTRRPRDRLPGGRPVEVPVVDDEVGVAGRAPVARHHADV